MPRAKPHPVLSDELLNRIAARFRVLGDASRLRVLNHRMQGERSVQELVDSTGQSVSRLAPQAGS